MDGDSRPMDRDIYQWRATYPYPPFYNEVEEPDISSLQKAYQNTDSCLKSVCNTDSQKYLERQLEYDSFHSHLRYSTGTYLPYLPALSSPSQYLSLKYGRTCLFLVNAVIVRLVRRFYLVPYLSVLMYLRRT